jgi:phospholipase/carboxylesterase
MTDLCAVPSTLVKAMTSMEKAMRRLHPLAIPALKEKLLAHKEPLETVQHVLLAHDSPVVDEHTRQVFTHAYTLILDSIRIFGTGDDATQAFMSVLRAMRKHCQAQEALFDLCDGFPQINRYFLEGESVPGAVPHQPGKTQLFHSIQAQDPYARGGYSRGGYSLFVPESYSPDHPLPLVVALHGGYGHGRDFLWTWLREARSRGFILMAPSSLGRTWSIANIPMDAQQLIRHVEEVCSRFTIEANRILMTGMSDGGTFALGFGFQSVCPAKAIAPVSCVLPPVDLELAGDRRVYWVHGAQDWMFPVSRAVKACKEISSAGADVRLKVVPDLSHAYPREENDAILRWFDPTLAS